MDDGFGLGVFLGILFGFLAAAGLGMVFNLQPSSNLTECARMNNVYACELIAVPVVPE